VTVELAGCCVLDDPILVDPEEKATREEKRKRSQFREVDARHRLLCLDEDACVASAPCLASIYRKRLMEVCLIMDQLNL
jgi:hypothetical protein